MIIIVDGSCPHRGAIAAALARRLSVECISGAAETARALRTGQSFVHDGWADVPPACSNLNVYLTTGRGQAVPVGYDLGINTGVLGDDGTAEVLKQFVVQRLVLCRESSRRV